MHVLRFAQLHSGLSLHNKSVRMKQNCSRKVRETPLLLPLKKEKNGKLKHHILPFSGSADHIRVYSSLIPAHFSIFRCHSGSFRYIPTAVILLFLWLVFQFSRSESQFVHAPHLTSISEFWSPDFMRSWTSAWVNSLLDPCQFFIPYYRKLTLHEINANCSNLLVFFVKFTKWVTGAQGKN